MGDFRINNDAFYYSRDNNRVSYEDGPQSGSDDENVRANYRSRDWKEELVKSLMKILHAQTPQDISIKEIQNMRKLLGDSRELSPTQYLKDLTTYLHFWKLDEETQLNLLQKAMTGSAAGWLDYKLRYIKG